VNRGEALALASKYVAEWTEQTKNQRGYVHDKWTPVEVETRTKAVLDVADWLLKPDVPTTLVAPARDFPPATIFGWRVGSVTCPEPSTYKMAKDRLRAIREQGQPVMVAETNALIDLVTTYERLAPQPGPHKHKASCHGAIGELLCGQDPPKTL
jgi:hypothetical protein